MTGFGKGEATIGNKKITVEVRSLNSKQLDLNLRMPSLYRQQEAEVRSRIARAAGRGKVDAFVTVESQGVQTPARINRALFAAYADQLREVAREAGFDTVVPGWEASALQCVMRLPEVISAETESVSEQETAALMAATDAACAQLDAFRAQEGAILIADLLRRVELIESYKKEVEPFEAGRTETVRARILDNIARLKVDVDSNRLEQEMIFYLEKFDITEEKVRLTNHCNYFREVAANEEGAGRKLGFIAQEMGREINTLGSKSNNAEMQIIVVQMKDELEQIKEQVLNVL